MHKVRVFCLLFSLAILSQAAQPLLVISVDGLDHRYLRDRDKLGLSIPNLRRLIAAGAWADGVVGVVPTVTWPSHTTMITGVRSEQHGILNNRRPRSEGGEYYWSASLLKKRTLWHAARDAGLKTAAITWPVTVDAAIDFNLPEYFERRNGGAMDLKSIESKGTPGLVEKIAKRFPSFAQEWMNDRTRALATIYLLEVEHPDLILVHLVDHDAEAHENGPFTREAKATIEYTDELLGQILKAAPANMVVAIVSDHGFERIDSVSVVPQGVELYGGLALARSADVATRLRATPGKGVEVTPAELARFAPHLTGVVAAFESAPHHLFASAANQQHERGVHGLWPGRKDYRATFLLWGRGIKREALGEIEMLSFAERFAKILGIRL